MSEPVAIIKRNVSGQIYMAEPSGEHFDMSKHVGVSLYPHDLVERKDAAIAELVGALKDAANRLILSQESTPYIRGLFDLVAKYDK